MPCRRCARAWLISFFFLRRGTSLPLPFSFPFLSYANELHRGNELLGKRVRRRRAAFRLFEARSYAFRFGRRARGKEGIEWASASNFRGSHQPCERGGDCSSVNVPVVLHSVLFIRDTVKMTLVLFLIFSHFQTSFVPYLSLIFTNNFNSLSLIVSVTIRNSL